MSQLFQGFYCDHGSGRMSFFVSGVHKIFEVPNGKGRWGNLCRAKARPEGGGQIVAVWDLKNFMYPKHYNAFATMGGPQGGFLGSLKGQMA